jgi:hypothetical protein
MSTPLATLESLLTLLANPPAVKAKLDELKAATASATEAKRVMADLQQFKNETKLAYDELARRHADEVAAQDKRFAAREVEISAREKRAAAAEAQAVAHEKEAQAKLDDAHARFHKAFG